MYKFTKIFFFLFFLLFSRSLFASNIDLEKLLPAGAEIYAGDEILVNLSLASGGKVQNALEGILSVSDNVEILNAITGNSIVSIWLENPSNFTGQNINFSGIIPAGYNNESGQIFSVVLRAKAAGTAKVSLSGGNTFLNDGLGTKTSVPDRTFSLNIKKATEGREPYKISVKDINPPENFKIELLKDPNLFEGKWVILWGAQDKGSGIASYNVVEGRKVFKQVSSPYPLENQRLNEKIYVKAYDHEGNIRVAELTPVGKVCLGVKCFGWSQIVILLIIIIVSVYLWRKQKKSFTK
jgi:hypothetical protein